MASVTIKLRPSHVTAKTIVLREPVAQAAASRTEIVLRAGHANPKNIIVRTNVPSGGSSPVDYTLTCAIGSYTLTGLDATLQAAFSLSADTGSYTISGQTATLVFDPLEFYIPNLTGFQVRPRIRGYKDFSSRMSGTITASPKIINLKQYVPQIAMQPRVKPRIKHSLEVKPRIGKTETIAST